jgi:glutathione S-transferase
MGECEIIAGLQRFSPGSGFASIDGAGGGKTGNDKMRGSSGMRPKLIIGNKNYSSWSLRAWLLLAEAGIDFDEIRLSLDTPDFPSEIAKYSRARRVPVLILDDQPVWDSLAIAETVAERWPEKALWPKDPGVRAYARSISAEMHAGFAILRDAMPMNCRAMGRKIEFPDALTAEIDRILEIWHECHDRFASDKGWLFGNFGVADAMFAPVMLRFRTYGINLPQSAIPYHDRLLKSEALQSWLLAAESETEVLEVDEAGR